TGSGDTYYVAITMSPLAEERVQLDLVDNDSIASIATSTPLGGAGAANGDFTRGTPIVIHHPGTTETFGVLDHAFLIADIGTDDGWDVVADADGNSYITGSFSGTVDFDPGPGTTALTSDGGSRDIFVAKYDIGGNLVFAVSASGPMVNGADHIAVSIYGTI